MSKFFVFNAALAVLKFLSTLRAMHPIFRVFLHVICKGRLQFEKLTTIFFRTVVSLEVALSVVVERTFTSANGVTL